MQLLLSLVSMGAIICALILRYLIGIPSGSVLFAGFNCLMYFKTFEVVTSPK